MSSGNGQKRTIALRTVGCRLNQYETEKMAASLYPLGFRRAEPGETADLCLINTCTVTHRADASSRNMISRLVRDNPGGRVVVAGCCVDSDRERVAALSGVDLLIGNEEKPRFREIVSQQYPELFDGAPELGCSETVADFQGHNRAWLKISDGCNQWCSFCILPTVRGRLQNRHPDEIVAEVHGLVAKEFYEVVLTGLHIGHYFNRRSEPYVKNLAALLRMLMDRTDVYRLRLSSIEPQSVRDDLIAVYRDYAPRICRHWHLPLQAASSRMLKAMRRPYDQNTYLRRLTSVREAVPNTIIGADVIVGFPGETDEDFNRSRRLVERSGLLDYLHVFSYSDRPGTRAADLPDKVSPEVIKERCAILMDISRRMRRRALKRQVGETLEVISEHRLHDKQYYWAVADNYLKVKLPAEYYSGRLPLRVKVTHAREDYLEGEPIGSPVAAGLRSNGTPG